MDKKDTCENFWDTYLYEIKPVLSQIDMMVKCGETPVPVDCLAELINTSSKEIRAIMKKNKIKKIDRNSLFIILLEGSSEICKLYRREVEKGAPLVYTVDDISYIYNLDRVQLCRVFHELGIIETTSAFFYRIFERLPSSGH